MYKSTLKKKPLNKPTQEVLEQVSQITIYNDGEVDVVIMGRTVTPLDNPFVVPGAGGLYFDFDLNEIDFPNGTPANNKVNIIYQKVILPKALKTPSNCNH